jgi:hypothetical protein
MGAPRSRGIDNELLDLPGALVMAILYLELRHYRPNSTLNADKRAERAPDHPGHDEKKQHVQNDANEQERIELFHEAPPFCGESRIA